MHVPDEKAPVETRPQGEKVGMVLLFVTVVFLAVALLADLFRRLVE